MRPPPSVPRETVSSGGAVSGGAPGEAFNRASRFSRARIVPVGVMPEKLFSIALRCELLLCGEISAAKTEGALEMASA
jgi:hypothetical protein